MTKLEEIQTLVDLHNRHVLPILAKQVQDRVEQIIRNPADPNRIYEQEFYKGVCFGLELASAIPQTLLEQAEKETANE